MTVPRVTVLVSGRGSNLAALLLAEREQRLGGTVTTAISNRANASAIGVAASYGIDATVIDDKSFVDRHAFDSELSVVIDASRPDLVVLAGFARILDRQLVARYENRMLNIHPSLLPSFPGLRTHKRALEAGVRIHGCTVHFVTAELDSGPIVAQAAVPVLDEDNESTLAERVLAAEHKLLPAAVRAFCEGRLVVAGARVRVTDERVPPTSLDVPSSMT